MVTSCTYGVLYKHKVKLPQNLETSKPQTEREGGMIGKPRNKCLML